MTDAANPAPLETHLLLGGDTGAGFARTLRAALPSGASLALALPDNALPALAHAAGRDPDVPDALVTLPAHLADAAPSLAKLADPQRSTIIAVQRHAVLPGRDAIRLFFGLRRLPALTQAAFHDYWLNHHAQIGRRLIPPFTYHQLHADEGQTLHAATASGLAASDYDGIVEVHFPDTEALIRQLSRTEVAQEALDDEKNFIDHARSRFWAFREEV